MEKHGETQKDLESMSGETWRVHSRVSMHAWAHVSYGHMVGGGCFVATACRISFSDGLSREAFISVKYILKLSSAPQPCHSTQYNPSHLSSPF